MGFLPSLPNEYCIRSCRESKTAERHRVTEEIIKRKRVHEDMMCTNHVQAFYQEEFMRTAFQRIPELPTAAY